MPQSRPWVCLRFFFAQRTSCNLFSQHFFLNTCQTMRLTGARFSHNNICETEHHWLIGIRPCSAHSVFLDCGFVSSQDVPATDIFVPIFELTWIQSLNFYFIPKKILSVICISGVILKSFCFCLYSPQLSTFRNPIL